MTAELGALARCPLCGEANACAMAATGTSESPCWCSAVAPSAALLASVPPGARGKVCICPRCIAAAAAPAPAGSMSVYGESAGVGGAKMGTSSLPGTTMTSFQLVGLPRAPFEPLFALPDAALAARGVRRVIADASPGFPCRISLSDAELGEELLLLPFEHQPANSPYRASGPIYVRPAASQRTLPVGHVPEYVTLRQISLRAYDDGHMIIGAEVCPGASVAAEIERQFANPQVSYIHLHNAKRGCFSCLVARVPAPSGDTAR